MKNALALCACAVAASLVACGRSPQDANMAATTDAAPAAAAPAADAAAATTALVALMPARDSKVSGTLTLTQDAGGVVVSGSVAGLTAGAMHGFHVHEKGDCSAPDFSSAGEHLNPTGAMHGEPGAAAGHHLGDMMNLQADDTGAAQVQLTINGATLRDGGAQDLIGKGVVVHAQPDDYTTQPSGNSGGRIACGAIG